MTEPVRILVVEDSPTQAMEVEFILDAAGFGTKVVVDLASGLEAVNEGFDVVLLDLFLPDASGLDGLVRMLEEKADQAIIVMTSLDDESKAIEALQQGAQDYIVKGRADESLLVKTIHFAIERHRILSQVRSLNEQKNQFLGMAAHDLRNPLGVIKMYSEFLLTWGEELKPEQKELVTTINRSSQFMLRLVEDLLDISRISAGRLELDLQPTDLVELARRNVQLNSVLSAQKEIEVAFVAPPEPLTISVDSAKIEQVLNNLISNAVKFSESGSTVTVSVERRVESVEVLISDEGQGIPEDERAKLFEPFERTSVKSTAGESSTGLGLAIVRRIVEGHGGEITVESEVGVGSTFHVRLPINVT